MKYNLCCDCPFEVNTPCLIQVENFCLWLFKIQSASCLLVRFSLSLQLATWSGNSFLYSESQVPKLLVASTSWLLTINRAVKINPQDCTSGGPRTDTQTGEPCKLHLFESLRLSGKPLPSKYSLESRCVYKSHLQFFIQFLKICNKCDQPINQLTNWSNKNKQNTNHTIFMKTPIIIEESRPHK